MTVVRSGGVALNVLDEGAGPPVVFLHGGGLTSHTWRKVIAELRGDYRCVAPDLRGHGDSDWAADYSLPALAADLRALVGTLGLERPHLVGMSLGGQTALHAVCHGLRVRSLSLVDVGPRMLSPADNPIRGFMRTHSYPDFASALDAAVASQPRRTRASLAEGLRRSMRERPDGSWAFTWDPARRESYDERSAAAQALWPLLGAVTVPVLVVRGSRSPVFGEQDAKELVATLPDARLETLEAGHNIQSEHPRDLAALLRGHHEDAP